MKKIFWVLSFLLLLGIQPCNAQNYSSNTNTTKEEKKANELMDLWNSVEMEDLKAIGFGWLLLIAAAMIIGGYIINDKCYDNSTQNVLIKLAFSAVVILVTTSFLFAWPFFWANVWPQIELSAVFIVVAGYSLWKTWVD